MTSTRAFTSAMLAVALLAAPREATAQGYTWVTPATFGSSGSLQRDFRATNDLTMSRTTTTNTGISIIAPSTRTFDATPPFNNPAWVAGVDRPLWRLQYEDDNSGADNGRIDYTMVFSGPGQFRTTDYMVFVNLDGSEAVNITARDAFNAVIPRADLVFEFWRGQESDAGFSSSWFSVTDVDPGVRSARLASTLGTASYDDLVVTVRSTQQISSLFYEFDINPTARQNFISSVSFNFVAGPEPTSVPEPTTAALLATGLLGLAGAARRRRRAVDMA